MMVPTFGIALVQEYAPVRLISLTKLVEECGYHSFWYADEVFYRDVFVGLALIASESRRLKLGPFVVNPYSRHPLILANSIASVDEIAPGRVILGLGAGAGCFRPMGIGREKPVTRLKETIQVIRRLLAGERVTFSGSQVKVTDAQLAYSASPSIPIAVASRGRRMLEMAGEVADMVVISSLVAPLALARAVSFVDQGSRRRELKDSTAPVYLRLDMCPADDLAEAASVLKPASAKIIAASYPHLEFIHESSARLPPSFQQLLDAGEIEATLSSWQELPDGLVDCFGLAGPWERITNTLIDLIERGIHRFILLPHKSSKFSSIEEVIEGFAKEVAPRLTRF